MTLGASDESLPPLYAGWLVQLLGETIPREERATCSACAMCARSGQEGTSKDYFFNPATKCCIYDPNLPNFLVGRILSDKDPAAETGRASLEQRIADAIGVTPLGVMNEVAPEFCTGR